MKGELVVRASESAVLVSESDVGIHLVLLFLAFGIVLGVLGWIFDRK